MTLIAEDLLLLVLDDEKGTLTTLYPQTALGGAVLIELAMAGAVEVDEDSSRWRPARVRAGEPEDPAALTDPLLQEARRLVAEKPRTAQDLVDRLGKGLRDRLTERLAERGVLRREESRVLGLFPRTRWPAADSTHEEEVRRALTATLVEGAEPDARTGALIALLHAIDRAHKVLDHPDLTNKEVRQRAKRIAEGAWAADAVRDAIAASTAAVTTAVIASTTAATVTSS